MRFHTVAYALCGLVAVFGTALHAFPLGSTSTVRQATVSEACGGADQVVVASVHRSPGAAIAHVTVLQVIKGHAIPRTVLPVQLPRFREVSGSSSGDDLTAIVFLKEDAAGWRLIAPAGENAPFGDLVLPGKERGVGDQISESCEDAVFARSVAAFDDRNIAWYRLKVVDWFNGFDSAAYREQLAALTGHNNREFRALGIEGRLILGDVTALKQLQAEAPGFAKPTLGELGVVLQAYRNPDPSGVAELGRIAALSEAKYASLVQGAAYSLHALHTSDTLPILYQLLDSADPAVRFQAMSGFASFVANFPIQRPQDAASNRNITPVPGGKYTTGDEDSHFPRVGSDNLDTIAFWKAWYQANFLNRR